jgi:hypothetical protein
MGELHTRLGRLLKAERERQNKSLGDISQDLKIAEGHLLAIEAGDLGGVPSELYFKLFARSYAESLGLDYAKAIEIIREEIHEGEPAPLNGESERPSIVRTTPLRAESSSKNGNGRSAFWLVVVAGILIISAVVWLILSKKDSFVFSGSDSDSTANEQVEPDTGTVVLSPSGNRENMALNLDLVARDRTWAVVIADGDTALQTNLKPWREYYIGAKDTLIVSIGTPLAVELMLNGTSANLTDPEHGAISSVVITPENLSMYIQRALEDSIQVTDSTRDSTIQDSTRPKPDSTKPAGTGSAPTKPAGKDTASTQRGTTDGL